MASVGHIPYTILSQNFSQELQTDGRFADVWEINFEGPSGTVGTIRVPAARYAALYVDQQIQEQLAKIETVHALGSAPPSELGITE